MVKSCVWLSVIKVRSFIGSLMYCGGVLQFRNLAVEVANVVRILCYRPKHTELSGKAPRCLPVVWMNLEESSLEPRIGLAHAGNCEIDLDT